MPVVGDIRKGYKTSAHRHIWAACPQCGKERWVVLSKGEPKYQLCTKVDRGESEFDGLELTLRQEMPNV